MTDFPATGTIQYDTISLSGLYRLTAEGAQGASALGGSGGLGAVVGGDVYFAAGTVLEIVTGEYGGAGNLGGGGGGGGSFIIETNDGTSAVDKILAVAGGGGGAGGGYTVGGHYSTYGSAPGHNAGTKGNGGNGSGSAIPAAAD